MSNYSVPFKNFYQANDITLCKNKKCEDRLSCIRYMYKPDQYWQFYFKENTKCNKDICPHYFPLFVWSDAKNNRYILKDISNNHLLAIIIHLYERYINGETHLLKLAKEFSKEARKRKLIE